MQATGAIFFSHPGHPAEAAPGQHNLIRPLLELALVQTSAQGGYVYRLEDGETNAELTAWAGLAPHNASGSPPDRVYPAVWTSEQCTPVVLHENAWSDWRFRSLVEFERHHFEGVASVPLVDGERLVGVVNFCRSRRFTLAPRDLSLLLNLGVPLGNLLTAAANLGATRIGVAADQTTPRGPQAPGPGKGSAASTIPVDRGEGVFAHPAPEPSAAFSQAGHRRPDHRDCWNPRGPRARPPGYGQGVAESRGGPTADARFSRSENRCIATRRSEQ